MDVCVDLSITEQDTVNGGDPVWNALSILILFHTTDNCNCLLPPIFSKYNT